MTEFQECWPITAEYMHPGGWGEGIYEIIWIKNNYSASFCVKHMHSNKAHRQKGDAVGGNDPPVPKIRTDGSFWSIFMLTKANTVSNQPVNKWATCSCHIPSQSPVCERTCDVLGKGGGEETDWRSAGGEETAAVLLLTPEPICSMVKRR